MYAVVTTTEGSTNQPLHAKILPPLPKKPLNSMNFWIFLRIPHPFPAMLNIRKIRHQGGLASVNAKNGGTLSGMDKTKNSADLAGKKNSSKKFSRNFWKYSDP